VVSIKLSKVLGVKRASINTSFFTIGILITGVLSILLAILTYYGSSSGNFIVVLDDEEYTRGIVLSDNAEFVEPSPILFADSIGGVSPTSYSLLSLNNVRTTDGNYYDDDFTYLAYTFYLKNIGTETVDITFSLKITELHKGVDKAIRVLVIEDEEDVKIYQKPDIGDTNYPPNLPETISFVSDAIIFQDNFEEFAPNQVKKFSIVIWLEGLDPDCNDDLLGGMIKTRLKFDIIDPDES